MPPFNQPPIFRLQVPGPGGEPRRQRRQQPHPPSVVAAVRHLVETTRLPFKIIGERTQVNDGTVSRWAAKHGWTRPLGAWPRPPRPDARYVPNLVGRALAQRLRIQAERLIAEVEGADRVDPAALAEALRLLEQARAEQEVRRGRKRVPPPARPPAAARPKPELDPATRAHVRETRRKGARKGWATRRSNQANSPDWLEAAAARAAARLKRRARRECDPDFPSPHLPT